MTVEEMQHKALVRGLAAALLSTKGKRIEVSEELMVTLDVDVHEVRWWYEPNQHMMVYELRKVENDDVQ